MSNRCFGAMFWKAIEAIVAVVVHVVIVLADATIGYFNFRTNLKRPFVSTVGYCRVS